MTSPQHDLFARRVRPARPARGRVDTSRRAAESMDPGVVEHDEKAILGALAKHGRLIRPELELRTGISTQSITARLRGLCKQGRLEKMVDSKPGPSGRPCHFYRLPAA